MPDDPIFTLLGVLSPLFLVVAPLAAVMAPARPRSRLTVGASMVIVGAVAVPCAILARPGSISDSPASGILAVWCIYALPIVVAVLYLPRRFARVVIVAWAGLWLSLMILMMIAITSID